MNIFYQPLIPEGIHHLDEEESRHCVKVLRRKKGDAIRITDGKGSFYNSVITDENTRACAFSITETFTEKARDYSVHIAISPTKNADRIEWFVEKSVEFGVDAITLIECHNTERAFIKSERLTKVAVSAMKQSLKAFLPVIKTNINFNSFVEQAGETGRFIAYVDQSNPLQLQHAARARQSSLVLIGPEGDFTKEELSLAITNGFQKVSLGASRLRTETAGVASCHILNLINS